MILSSLSDNIVFFYPPSEIHKITDTKNKVRIGGVVEAGSVKYIDDYTIYFVITDSQSRIGIYYDGLIPALFREGQGIVAEGFLNKDKQIFTALKLLTKHDENYTPPVK